MGFWPVVKRVVKDSDIVLFIVDVRMPSLSRNKDLEYMAKHFKKKILTVFNKTDLVTKRTVDDLRVKYPNAFFVSGTQNLGIGKLKTGIMVWAKRMGIEGKAPTVGVVGYPNVGKSSIINCLAKRAKAKTSNIAGTTRGIQWVRAGGLNILDSPGVVPLQDSSVKLSIVGAKDPEKVKFPELAAYELVQYFLAEEKLDKLVERYGIVDSVAEADYYEIFLEIGRRRGFLKKGGEVDERKTAIHILRDWQRGKLTI